MDNLNKIPLLPGACLKWLMLLVTLATLGLQATAQVKGRVVSDKGSPLPGATVTTKTGTSSAVTNDKGTFSLAAKAGDTVVVSYIGYQSTAIPVKTNSNLGTITLKSTYNTIDQLVVTGYQTQKKADLTGSVAVAKISDIKDIPNSNPMQALQGRVPGLYVTTNGDPGAAAGVVIRGFNTLGSNAPLYIIDGVPTTQPSVFQSLDPNTIESVQILKDASAASIYGSRASNGVIIVTTRQGVKGKVRVEFNNSITLEKYVSKVNVLDSRGMGKAIWQAAVNDGADPNSSTTLFSYVQHPGTGGSPVLDQINIVPFLGGDSSVPSANTDWQNLVFHPGIITSNDLTITAGSDHSSLLLNLNYLNNTGLIKYNSGYRRYGGRVNVATTMLGGNLKIGNNVQFYQASETPVPSDLGGASTMYDAIFVSPLIPVYTKSGAFAGPLGSGFTDRDNPLYTLYLNRWNKNNDFNVFGNLFAEVHLPGHLVFHSNFGYSYDNTYDRLIAQKYSEGFINRTTNSLTINQGRELDLTWSNTLNYHLETGRQSLDVLLGTEAITRNFVTQQDNKQGFALQNNDYFQLSAGTGLTTNSGTSTGNKLLSFFGKVNYSLASKYLASVTVRRDGSSRFGANDRYGWFPAVSVGWRISNEKFLKDIPWLTNLKLRSGVGVTGNQEIGDVASLALYQTNYGTVGETGPNQNYAEGANNGTAYDISGAGTGNLPSGYVSVQAAKPDLKWESTLEYNQGGDFGFFDGRLYGSFDYFSRKTKNILVQPPYPGIEGEGQIKWVNGATKSNKGWELELGFQDKTGALSYSVNGNLFSFHDEITYLPPTVVSAYPGDVDQTILGHSSFSMFGYVVQGIYQNQHDVAAHATQPGAAVGRLLYKDLNNDGKIDASDQTWIGVQLPKLNYGLQVNIGYKAFSFSLFLQGIQGIQVNNGNKAATDFVGLNPGVNFGARTLQAWTPQNPHASIPALSLVDNNDEARFSSYFIENGSYLKLRNVELGYTVPYKIRGIDAAKIYLMGENLLTFKKRHGADPFTGPDPELPGSNYPIPLKLTAGVNLSF
jgi:TonB-linked SusC/RagA family outer membrane protein